MCDLAADQRIGHIEVGRNPDTVRRTIDSILAARAPRRAPIARLPTTAHFESVGRDFGVQARAKKIDAECPAMGTIVDDSASDL
jgi:hypothetical protein